MLVRKLFLPVTLLLALPSNAQDCRSFYRALIQGTVSANELKQLDTRITNDRQFIQSTRPPDGLLPNARRRWAGYHFGYHLSSLEKAAQRYHDYLSKLPDVDNLTPEQKRELRDEARKYLQELAIGYTMLLKAGPAITPGQAQAHMIAPEWPEYERLFPQIQDLFRHQSRAFTGYFGEPIFDSRYKKFKRAVGDLFKKKAQEPSLEEPIQKLQELDALSMKYDVRSKEFLDLAKKKIDLIRKHFGRIPPLVEYANQLESEFNLSDKTYDPARGNIPGRIQFEHMDASAIYRLPGQLIGNLESARTTLRNMGVVRPQTKIENGKEVFDSGQNNLFLAAEKLALARRADSNVALSPEENRLAELYENTISYLRGVEVALPSNQHALFASQVALENFQGSGAPSIPATIDGLSGSTGEYEFAKDRLRYFFHDPKGKPVSADEMLNLNLDVTTAHSDMYHRETWWYGEKRFVPSYAPWNYIKGSGPVGAVANSQWDSTFPGKSKLITEDNVPNGPITQHLVNGRGYQTGKSNILTRTGSSSDRVTRLYDPAQRETGYMKDYRDWKEDGEAWAKKSRPGNVRNSPDLAGPRTVGWQMVGEVDMGKSGNPLLQGVIRRMFWSEAHQEGRDARSPILPGTLGGGQMRFAQQSIPIKLLVADLKDSDPRKALLQPVIQWMDKNPDKTLPENLSKSVQDAFKAEGEVDAVRGEVVVSIEALVDKNGVRVPLVWAWDGKTQSWEPQKKTTEKQGKEKENLIKNCAACHGTSVTKFSGACKRTAETVPFFRGAARRILTGER